MRRRKYFQGDLRMLRGDADALQASSVGSSERDEAESRLIARRRWIQWASAGTTLAVLGGIYTFVGDSLTQRARAETRPDGRPRLPPGQRVIKALKPMGGMAASPARSDFKLRVHGHVEAPFSIDFNELLQFPVRLQSADVHCVTGWSMLGGEWRGVRISDLIARARPKEGAHFLIIEAAHGYTANVPLIEATRDNCLVTWELDGRPLQRTHGAPARALIPDLYFWKSAKWITGLRVERRDQPGYWEVRGYHNHADPWKEERRG